MRNVQTFCRRASCICCSGSYIQWEVALSCFKFWEGWFLNCISIMALGSHCNSCCRLRVLCMFLHCNFTLKSLRLCVFLHRLFICFWFSIMKYLEFGFVLRERRWWHNCKRPEQRMGVCGLWKKKRKRSLVPCLSISIVASGTSSTVNYLGLNHGNGWNNWLWMHFRFLTYPLNFSRHSISLTKIWFFYQLAHSSAVIKQFSDPFWCLFCKLLLTALHIMKICKSKFLINLIKPSLSLLKVDLKEEINIVDKSLDNHFFTILSLQENNNRKYFM